jgi:hypothetical protein
MSHLRLTLDYGDTVGVKEALVHADEIRLVVSYVDPYRPRWRSRIRLSDKTVACHQTVQEIETRIMAARAARPPSDKEQGDG